MLYGVKNPHGGDRYGDGIALDFSANVSPLGTPKCVTEAIERGLPELYRYPDPYCRALVQAIARYEGVPGEFILCGNGASELIYAYCEAVRPGRAMELAPTFSEYSLALQRRGCGVVRFALSQEEKFDLQERFLARLAREKIDAFCSQGLYEELWYGGAAAGVRLERGWGLAAEDVGGGAAVECLGACTGGGRRRAGRCGIFGEEPRGHPRGAPAARRTAAGAWLLGVSVAGELHSVSR